MMLSDDKISHITHVVLKRLLDNDIVDIIEEESAVRREMKQTIIAELKIGEDMDESVRKKIQSLAKKIIEGSPEWEVLYKKYYREEEIKKGRASGS